MKSHEYAEKLKQAADFLLSKPEFETSHNYRFSLYFWGDKEPFLAAVTALGSGVKEWSKDELTFFPDGVPDKGLALRVNRSAVCRKVQEEKWECEPLLSQAEEALVGKD